MTSSSYAACCLYILFEVAGCTSVKFCNGYMSFNKKIIVFFFVYLFTGKLLQYHFSFLFLRWKISKMHILLQSISENKSGFIFLLLYIIFYYYT